MTTPIEQKPTPPAGNPERGEPLRQIVAAATEPASSHLGARLRSYFLTGLIVVGPVAITIYVVWWFITLVDAWVKPLIPPQYLPEHYLPFNVPGVGLIFGITGVMLVGALTANLFGRTLVTYSEMMLARMPIVRSVYRTLKQIFETVLSKNGGSFKRVGLIEFRGAGSMPSCSSPASRRSRWRRRSATAIPWSPCSCRTARTLPLGSSCLCRQAR